MKNRNVLKTNKIKRAHSAEYFGEERNYWWNQDFLASMAQRLELDQYRRVLDAGCGVGHWSRTLDPFLHETAQITGIDREKDWISAAHEKAKGSCLHHRLRYVEGDVRSLPFEDESFDLVTCQTLLIHLENPLNVLKEFKRVLKPKGLILVCEPNNAANTMISSSLMQKLTTEEVMFRVECNYRIQKGKQVLGESYNSLGDFVPGLMYKAGFKKIKVRLRDKATSFIPPYSSPEEQAYIKTLKDWCRRGFIGWDREDLQRYFKAGEGSDTNYERYVETCLSDQKAMLQAIEEQSYHSAGGHVFYLISAYKE